MKDAFQCVVGVGMMVVDAGDMRSKLEAPFQAGHAKGKSHSLVKLRSFELPG